VKKDDAKTRKEDYKNKATRDWSAGYPVVH
jgi:hypothetical protein